MGAASGAGIAIGAYFAFYGAATNLLVRHTELKRGQVAFVAGAAAAVGGSVVKVPLAVCIRYAAQADEYHPGDAAHTRCCCQWQLVAHAHTALQCSPAGESIRCMCAAASDEQA